MKSYLKKLFLFLLLATLLSSCASNIGGYTSTKDVQERLLGMSAEEVASKLGAPTEKITISESIQVWTYRSEASGLTGGDCEISTTIKKGKVTSAVINKNDLSPLVAPLGSCRRILGNLD